MPGAYSETVVFGMPEGEIQQEAICSAVGTLVQHRIERSGRVRVHIHNEAREEGGVYDETHCASKEFPEIVGHTMELI